MSVKSLEARGEIQKCSGTTSSSSDLQASKQCSPDTVDIKKVVIIGKRLDILTLKLYIDYFFSSTKLPQYDLYSILYFFR